MSDYLFLDKKTTVIADDRMNNETVKKLWDSFTLTTGEICFEKGEEFTFRLGNTQLPILPKGKEYVLNMDENGAAIVGKDYGGLMRGFMSFLMKIEYGETSLKIKAVLEESNYKIHNRMIHICVFPENDLYFIKKLIRLSALCQYTHIVIEFWGMLKYDCLKELAWPHAFTKEQAKELICECRELGIEPIPMFNQLGHATACRLIYGKHVVLDQNPKLQSLFTPDGWAWNIRSEKVFNLLKQVRHELYEIFSDCEYFHLGCDEAYSISANAELRKELPKYLSDLTKEVEKEGKKPMIWMDMLLEANTFKDCYGASNKEEAEILRKAVAKSTVFIDWQYDCFTVPIPSLVSLKDCGHSLLGAPWDNVRNYSAHIDTIAQNDMFGIMYTTWDTLKNNMQSVVRCAKKCGASSFVWSEQTDIHVETATMLRKVSFEGNSYTDCGWSKEQIEV